MLGVLLLFYYYYYYCYYYQGFKARVDSKPATFELAIISLIPSNSYTLYCMSLSYEGDVNMLLEDVLKTATNFKTLCCKIGIIITIIIIIVVVVIVIVIIIIVTVSLKYNVLSRGKSYVNMIDINIDTSPSKKLYMNISAINITANTNFNDVSFYPIIMKATSSLALSNASSLISKSNYVESWKVSVIDNKPNANR